MPTPKSKRQTRARRKTGKTLSRSCAAQATARKTAKLKTGAKSASGPRHRYAPPQTGRAESKQSRIIAMLRAPSGATIDAMVQATGWLPHSVRGFLAGIVRKKLSLNLVSAEAETGRVYQIIERTASSTLSAATTDRAG
jgi:Protein of unknown function (DUF3489)